MEPVGTIYLYQALSLQYRGRTSQKTGEAPLVRPSINEKVSVGKTVKLVSGALRTGHPVTSPTEKERLVLELLKPTKTLGAALKCDVCGESALGGQVTAHSVLCRHHMKRLLDS